VKVPAYRRLAVTLRAALLMPLAAMTVHQLRYYLVFGPHAAGRLAREGHAYLATLEPFVLLVATLAVGAFVGRLARAFGGRAEWANRSRATPGTALLWTWLLCACALLALYCGQELAEGALASGHPAGVAGILGHGGFIAVPLAALVGGLLALALRTAEALVALAARRAAESGRARPDGPSPAPIPLQLPDWRLEPQSGVVAGRAPPPARLAPA
jgi:hypothetical protein